MTERKVLRLFAGLLAAFLALLLLTVFFAADTKAAAATLLADAAEETQQTDTQQADTPGISRKTLSGGGEALLWKNEETGYTAVLLDLADLLTETEEREAMEHLKDATNYCNAIFLSNTDSYTGSEVQYGGRKMEEICADLGLDDYTAVLYMVDMHKRKLVIAPSKKIFNVITTDISNTITDNTYTYASRGDYAGAIRETFAQICRVFDGQAIAQPMRYITAALLAVFAGLAISLIAVRTKTKRKEAGYRDLTAALQINRFEPGISAALVSTKRVKHVEVSSGGGHGGHGGGFGGGGGGGFSGGGGGGFSGGGGSHSF